MICGFVNLNLLVFLVLHSFCSTTYGHYFPEQGGVVFPKFIGYDCTLSSGETGICLDLNSCPSVLTQIWKNKEKPTHCGFIRFTPIVCCPLPRTHPKVPQVPLLRGAGGDDLVPSPSQIDFDCGISHPLHRITSRSWRGGFPRFKRHVVGGKETEVGKYPWMALVGILSGSDIKWICDGVLIHPEWVLSAAHCVLDVNSYVVRLGEHNITSTTEGTFPVDYRVTNISFHPDFKIENGYHDMVLLKLSLPVQINRFIMPVCLPWGDQTKLEGRQAKLAGWGAEKYGGSLSNVLRDAVVTIFESTVCDKSYSSLPDYKTLWPKGITKENIICAGGPDGGVDSCQGDSGGPLVIRKNGYYTLIGIVSKGFGCGIEEFPGIYVSVKSYLKWIIELAFSEMDIPLDDY